MTLDDIPPDITLRLTTQMDRLFKAAGCEPTCHSCYVLIEVNDLFKLATHKDKDVMLCDIHNVKDLIVEEERQAELLRKEREEYIPGISRFRGYFRPHLEKSNDSSQQTEADQAGAADEKEEAKRQGWNEEEEIEKPDPPPLV